MTKPYKKNNDLNLIPKLPAHKELQIKIKSTWFCQKWLRILIELDKPTNKTIYIFKLKIRFGFGNRPKAEFYHSQLFWFGRLWKLQLPSFSAWDLFKMYVCALYVLCASPLAVMRYFMPKWFHKGFSVVMDWHFTHLTKKRRIRYGMKYIFFIAQGYRDM